MSMWEIEALMENTVRLIDKSENSAGEKRNLIWNTYNIQSKFDCSFTHFRLMDILIKHDFVQQYEVKDFPMYSEYPDFFIVATSKDFEWIREKPLEKWSEANPELAYWDDNYNRIFADFGSQFYTNHPTEKATELHPLDFGLQVIKDAYKQNDKSSIYNWTAFLIIYILEWFPSGKTTEELKSAYFQKIKTIFQQYEYTDYTVLHRGLDLYNAEIEDYFSEAQIELIKFVIQK